MKGVIITNKLYKKLIESENPPEDIQFALNMVNSLNLDLDILDYEKVTVTLDNENDGKYYYGGELRDLPDFAISIALSERDDYNLQAAKRMFETKGCKYVNSVQTTQIAKDKLYSLQLIKEAIPEIKVPKTMLINQYTTPEMIEDYIGLPCVVKIMDGLQGKGVTLAKNKEELKTILTMLFAAENNNQYIAQEAIMTSKGRDLRIAIADGELIYSFVRSSGGDDFRSNTHVNGTIEDYNPSDELLDLSFKVAEAINLPYGSIDYLFGEDDEEFYLCEVNTFPGFSRLLQAIEENDEDTIRIFKELPQKLLK